MRETLRETKSSGGALSVAFSVCSDAAARRAVTSHHRAVWDHDPTVRALAALRVSGVSDGDAPLHVHPITVPRTVALVGSDARHRDPAPNAGFHSKIIGETAHPKKVAERG